MNINQAQQLSGVSSDNIRFYEKQGLLCPRRNRANDYREYSEDDIRTLKFIRILRMLDMPLPQIRDQQGPHVPKTEQEMNFKNKINLKMQISSTAESWDRVGRTRSSRKVEGHGEKVGSRPKKNFFFGINNLYFDFLKIF